jgi:histidinol-phosphatase
VADDLALALELADLADEITIARYRSAELVVETKPDLTPVTEADRAVEEAVRARLGVARPDDGVIGEEFGAAAGSIPGRNWIIDPIDGTKGYVRGIPVWSTLLALSVDGEITIGVASAPELNRRWWASRGDGAWVNDGLPGAPRKLRVSSVRELSDAQASFGDLDDWRGPGRLETLLELSRRCWRTGGYGDVFTYMLVAEGAVDIGVYPEVKLWDLAAAKVIVEEAGGRFTDFSGVARADGGSGLATNGLIHDAALEVLRSG